MLDELEEIKICIAYELKWKEIDYLPAAVEDQLKVKPIYKAFKAGGLLQEELRILINYHQMLKNILMNLKKVY